eukprot:4301669-Pyramimonas_sp.AAC.1
MHARPGGNAIRARRRVACELQGAANVAASKPKLSGKTQERAVPWPCCPVLLDPRAQQIRIVAACLEDRLP